MMTNIRLSNPSDLKSLLVIENNTNPSPWTEKQMQSSFDVGHHSFCVRITMRMSLDLLYMLQLSKKHIY